MSKEINDYNAMPSEVKATVNILALGIITPFFSLTNNFSRVVSMCYAFAWMEFKRLIQKEEQNV